MIYYDWSTTEFKIIISEVLIPVILWDSNIKNENDFGSTIRQGPWSRNLTHNKLIPLVQYISIDERQYIEKNNWRENSLLVVRSVCQVSVVIVWAAYQV